MSVNLHTAARPMTRRFFAAAAVAALTLLAACGDSEPDQRKAFTAFLQTRIVDKPGIHVPRPTAEQTKSFGPYAEHYALITGFNDEMDQAMRGPYKIAQTAAPRTIQDVLARRNDIQALGEAMTAVEAKMRGTLADIESKRVSLRQPDDLKPVFAAAYVRTVTAPAEAFLATIPPVTDTVRLSLRLADYLDSHRASVKVNGAMIQTSDAKAQAEINQMLDALKAQNQRLNDARRRLQTVISGK
jgi:hypothetical protein